MADTQIAFRSSAEVREALRRLARRQGRSMQAVLDDLCRRALAADGETPTLAPGTRAPSRRRRSRGGVRVRPEADLVADIARHGWLILDLTRDLDEATFVRRFGDGINPFAAAISYALVSIGAACRQLVGGGEDAGGPPPAPIVVAHPEIDWRGWSGLRNVLTHGYHRRDPPVIWRATGELTALVRACEPRMATSDQPGS